MFTYRRLRRYFNSMELSSVSTPTYPVYTALREPTPFSLHPLTTAVVLVHTILLMFSLLYLPTPSKRPVQGIAYLDYQVRKGSCRRHLRITTNKD